MPELRLPAKCLTTQEDETAFFDQIPPVTMAYPEIYEYVIEIEDELATKATLLTLLELFKRYGAPLNQFAAFETTANREWFRDPKAWWYEAVFLDEETEHGFAAAKPSVH